MNRKLSDQLEKVLALADSAHDGEALAALRKGRALLKREGLNFGDLARTANPKPRFNPIAFFSGASALLEAQLVRLRQQLQDVQADIHSQAAQTEFWRRRTEELEHNLTASRSEAGRWQQLARETAAKLWVREQPAEDDEFANDPAAEDGPKSLKAASGGE